MVIGVNEELVLLYKSVYDFVFQRQRRFNDRVPNFIFDILLDPPNNQYSKVKNLRNKKSCSHF